MVGQMDVFGHYSYMLSMNGAQVGLLQEACHVILHGLLQYLDSMHPVPLHYIAHQAC